MPTKIRVLSESINGFNVIEIAEGKYKDVKYVYGSVEFKEQENNAIVSFDYELQGEYKIDEDFTQVIGDILMELLEEQLEKNEVVFRGGV